MITKTAEDIRSCRCPTKPRRSGMLSLVGGIVIALLPKCPFCLLAYSSAITMCSGTTIYNHQPGWFSAVSIGLALVVVGTIIRNFRGPRSGFALVLALLGTGAVAVSELVTGQLAGYQTGAYLLLAGALFNGGLIAVLGSWGGRLLRWSASKK